MFSWISTYLSRNLIFFQSSQFSALYYLAGFQHSIYEANASISKSIFSKGLPSGLKIRIEIDSRNLFWLDSKGFTNVYCDSYLSYWFERCVMGNLSGKLYWGHVLWLVEKLVVFPSHVVTILRLYNRKKADVLGSIVQIILWYECTDLTRRWRMENEWRYANRAQRFMKLQLSPL